MSRLDLESLVGDQTIDFECPSCESTVTATFKELSHEGNQIKCPNCQENITITHDENFKQTLHSANKLLRDFERTVRKLGK